MSDENNMAINEGVEEQTLIDQQPSIEEKAQVTESTAQEAPDANGEQRTETSEPRVTRGQKRIQELVGKLKEVQREPLYGGQQTTPVQTGQAGLPWETSAQSNPFEGMTELDPQQLDAHISDRARTMAQLEVMQWKQQEAFKASVHDFASDAEKTAQAIQDEFRDSPEIAEHLTESLASMVQKFNVDQNGQFVPRYKASELLQELKKPLEVARVRGQAQASATLAIQADEGALRPGSSSQKNTSASIEELRKEMKKNPGKVARELEARLGIGD